MNWTILVNHPCLFTTQVQILKCDDVSGLEKEMWAGMDKQLVALINLVTARSPSYADDDRNYATVTRWLAVSKGSLL